MTENITPDLLWSFIIFAFVTSVTPGPNNVMLTSSGLTFGFRRTIPHILGIGIGFVFMVIAIGLGLGVVFELYPVLYTILKYIGAIYLLYLAWGIARSGPVEGGEQTGRPLTFLEAAAFQWVNPKCWVMALGAIVTYTPQTNFYVNLLVIALIFGVVNIPSVGLWAVFGSMLRNVLRAPKAIKAFNIAMAVLLVLSLYPVAAELLP